MEQPIQQVAETKLPIKTKIAAWWMVGIGLLGIGERIKQILWRINNPEWLVGRQAEGFLERDWITWIIVLLLLAIILISGILILNRRKCAWYIGMFLPILISVGFGILSIYDLFLMVSGGFFPEVIISIIFFLIINFIFLFSPILLLFDRKNFWKVAR